MPSTILRLPKPCDIHENLLVEELVFCKSPLDYHYGKCSVIGKLVYDDGKYYLENIRLRCLDEKYRMKTASIRIRLLPVHTMSSSFNGSFAEVHGETVFLRRSESDSNSQPFKRKQKSSSWKTTVDIINRMRSEFVQFNEETQGCRYGDDVIDADDACQIDQIGIDEYLERFPNDHEPAIKLFTMEILDQAEELIECNLKLRIVMKKLKQISK